MHHASLNPTYFSDDSCIVLVVIRAHTVTLCVDIQATSEITKVCLIPWLARAGEQRQDFAKELEVLQLLFLSTTLCIGLLPSKFGRLCWLTKPYIYIYI